MFAAYKTVLLIAILAVVGMFGCSKKQQPTSQLSLEVRHLSGEQGFTVVWRTTEPVRGVAFTRQKDPFRGRTWEVMTPGLVIANIGGREALVAPAPQKEFRVRFRSLPFEVYNDYALTTPFSDGSVALFIGHLQARPFNCTQADCLAADSFQEIPVDITSTTLVPRRKERITTHQGRLDSASAFTGDPMTLVYFGKLPVREMSGFRVILDPELPRWVQKDFAEHLPRLLDLYTRELGFALVEKPLLFFPHPFHAQQRIEKSSGGVIGSQVILSLEGAKWKKRSRARREEFLLLIAHEAFHLWNANLFHSPDVPGGSWLHEGSAEAISQRALLDLGLISKQRYIDLQTEAINRCIVNRDMRARGSHQDLRREQRSHYDCGDSLHFLLQVSSGRDPRQEFSLYKLWADLFQAAATRDHIYTHDMFFEQVNMIAGDVAASLQSFALGEPVESDLFFVSIFQTLGIFASSMQREFPRWYERLMAQRTVEFIVDRDCQGKGFYAFSTEGIELIGGTVCETVKTPHRLDSIENFTVFDEGVGAYDYVYETCRSKPQASIVFRHADGYLTLKCAPLPQRPRFIYFNSSQVHVF